MNQSFLNNYNNHLEMEDKEDKEDKEEVEVMMVVCIDRSRWLVSNFSKKTATSYM